MLLATPRASISIPYRIRGASNLSLTVQALLPHDEANALSAAEGEVDEVRDAKRLAEIVSLSLYSKGSRVFASPEDVENLSESEFSALGREVISALAIISPSYARSDWQSWESVLADGAKHSSNVVIASRMYWSADVSLGYGGDRQRQPRPDRFFGLPMCELTDGHWMVYDAAWRATAARTGEDRT